MKMQEYSDTLSSSITELRRVMSQIAKLNLRHKELNDSIISALGHNHEGQKSYEYTTWKIEVKTPFVYSLNKRLYEESKQRLPQVFNPVKESISYTIDKRLCDRYIVEAPQEVRNVLIELIDKKPGKASVSVKELV